MLRGLMLRKSLRHGIIARARRTHLLFCPPVNLCASARGRRAATGKHCTTNTRLGQGSTCAALAGCSLPSPRRILSEARLRGTGRVCAGLRTRRFTPSFEGGCICMDGGIAGGRTPRAAGTGVFVLNPRACVVTSGGGAGPRARGRRSPPFAMAPQICSQLRRPPPPTPNRRAGGAFCARHSRRRVTRRAARPHTPRTPPAERSTPHLTGRPVATVYCRPAPDLLPCTIARQGFILTVA